MRFEGQIDRCWASGATMLNDDRRAPILWVTGNVGSIYDMYSVVCTEGPHSAPTLRVGCRCLIDTCGLHRDVEDRMHDFEMFLVVPRSVD